MKCTLCNSVTGIFSEQQGRRYHQCTVCKAVLMDPSHYVDRDREQERYEEHNNDVEDPRYQKFVKPVVDAVVERCDSDSHGLDFGSGTGPVITKLLRERGFTMSLYDPFFCPKPENLEQIYDFVVSCEVIEHFHHPYKEFKRLQELIHPSGYLFCKTKLYTEDVLFKGWRYRHDPTHVIFYMPETLQWIAKEFDLKLEYFGNDVIIYQKKETD